MRAASVWSPEQYHRFQEERRQPFFDLLSLVEQGSGMRIVDLGCGTGELTEILHEQLCASETIGVDNADSMLARAHTRTREGLRFEAGDLASYGRAASFDLVFSNAALHWVPDHPLLLARLSSLVRDGGQLAVQVPDNFDQPSHTAANAAAAEEPFRTALGAYTKPVHVLPPERYAVALHALGFDSITVRMQVYLHLLPNRDDVVEWVKGTTLTAFQERMPEGVFMAFLERYRALLFEQLPDERPFPFTFKRILMWGRKRRAE